MRISDWSSDVCSSDLAQCDDAHDVHVMMRARADIVRIGHAVLHEPHRCGLEFAVRLFEPAREIGEFAVLRCGAFGVADRAEGLHRAAAVLRELRSEEHTSELPSLMRTSYAVLCLKKNT